MSAALGRQNFAIDPLLLGAVLCLAVLGTIMVSSSSIAFADHDTGQPLFFLYQHLLALAIGAVGLGFAALIPTTIWYRFSWLPLLGGLGLLAFVLLPNVGETVNGSTRWIEVGPLRMQASEPARLFLIMYLASYAVRRNSQLASSFLGFLKPMLIVVIASVLLLAEPDFGATVVLTATGLGILFAAGGRIRDFLIVACGASVALVFIALGSAYRVDRIMTFRNPWQDPYADGFQLVQSLIAIGRGDWLGVGLGESVQKLFYLPEAHTDFVFAVLAEELGFVGSTLVIVLFAVFVWRAVALGQRALAANLPFHGLLSIGIGITIGLQAGINVGVNTGLLPTKGLTLPLISYGRSSAVVTLFAIGLLFRICRELQQAEQTLQRALRQSTRREKHDTGNGRASR
jgi:cell division protein FtsW